MAEQFWYSFLNQMLPSALKAYGTNPNVNYVHKFRADPEKLSAGQAYFPFSYIQGKDEELAAKMNEGAGSQASINEALRVVVPGFANIAKKLAVGMDIATNLKKPDAYSYILGCLDSFKEHTGRDEITEIIDTGKESFSSLGAFFYLAQDFVSAQVEEKGVLSVMNTVATLGTHAGGEILRRALPNPEWQRNAYQWDPTRGELSFPYLKTLVLVPKKGEIDFRYGVKEGSVSAISGRISPAELKAIEKRVDPETYGKIMEIMKTKTPRVESPAYGKGGMAKPLVQQAIADLKGQVEGDDPVVPDVSAGLPEEKHVKAPQGPETKKAPEIASVPMHIPTISRRSSGGKSRLLSRVAPQAYKDGGVPVEPGGAMDHHDEDEQPLSKPDPGVRPQPGSFGAFYKHHAPKDEDGSKDPYDKEFDALSKDATGLAGDLTDAGIAGIEQRIEDFAQKAQAGNVIDKYTDKFAELYELLENYKLQLDPDKFRKGSITKQSSFGDLTRP